MTLPDLLAADCVASSLSGTTKDDVLSELAALVSSAVPADAEQIRAVLQQRERLNTTAIGEGIAIPHGRLGGISQVHAGFARCPAGVDFQSVDGQPTRLFFVLLAPEDAAAMHLKALARVTRILKGAEFRQHLLDLDTREEIYRALIEEDGRF